MSENRGCALIIAKLAEKRNKIKNQNKKHLYIIHSS